MRLASLGSLNKYLNEAGQRAMRALDNAHPDLLLTENGDVLVAELLAEHIPSPVQIDWNSPTRSEIAETTIVVRDVFDRGQHSVPGSRLVVRYPVSGTADLLGYEATRSYMTTFDEEIDRGALVIDIVATTLTAQVVEGKLSHVRSQVEEMSGWANNDLRAFRNTIEQRLRQGLEARRARILSDRDLAAALSIPVRSSGVTAQAVPARRRTVTLETRRQQQKFIPEPVLDDAIYQDVLAQAMHWAAALERSPSTAGKFDEEELRDQLLVALNAYWEGGAGGELFNGAGKTDVLIREGDRNVFIAECKIWRGPKSAADALDQLVSYLVWRDSKAALVIFIKTRNPAATITSLHAAIQGHERHQLTQPGGTPDRRVDYVISADDEGRSVSVAVLPVVISGQG